MTNGGSRDPPDAELRALGQIVRIMAGVDPAARPRMMHYLDARFANAATAPITAKALEAIHEQVEQHVERTRQTAAAAATMPDLLGEIVG